MSTYCIKFSRYTDFSVNNVLQLHNLIFNLYHRINSQRKMKIAIVITLLVLSAIESESEVRLWRNPGKQCQNMNKELVLEFYQKLFGDKNFDAIDEYLGDPYIQHNPLIRDGKEGLREFVQTVLKNEPKRKLDIRRVGADGDLVWIHLKLNLFGKDNAIMDVFRVENDKIVEHWDVVQEVPKTSLNNNTMF